MLMKKQFQSKAVPRGTRTIWRYLGALFILFTFAVGNVWGAYDVPADGTVTLSQKVNNGGRFNVEASGVYHFRTSSGYSWDSSNGIKTQSNEGGVVFYLDASKEIEVGIVHTEAKNAHDVTVHVYSITESVYKQFDDNKAGAAESNRTFSTAPTSSTDGSFTISITAESKTFTGKKTLAAGYYAVVPVGEKSKTFFKTIKFTTTGGGTDVCPSGLTISSKDSKTAFTEGDAIELTASLTAGNGDISYQWYKGSVAPANAISGATNAKYEVASCTTANAGDYFCVASKTSCDDAVNSSAFTISVAADTKCFNMPAITSKPSDLASVTVTGGSLADVSTAKSLAMNAAGLKLDGNSVYLKVTLANASIVEGTKITVAWKNAGDGAGIALVNENLEAKVIDETGVATNGSVTHTFTAEEAANYADEFIIHRNASGTSIYVNAITVEDCGPAVIKHAVTLNYNDGVTDNGTLNVVAGKAAVKPADPTRGKYTFLGWFVGDTDNEYVWSTAVTGDITLKAHWQDPWTISFDADGGSEVADITVKHNTAADKPTDPTKDDNDFLGWFNGENAYDWTAVVTGNLNLKAHWAPIVAKYDVEYYDGETKIGTEAQVWANQHPTATGINTYKPLYTFVGWYTSSTLEGDPVALNTVTPVEGLKIYGKWAKAYASNADFEAYIIANTSEKDDSVKADAYVKSLNYALSRKLGTTFDANNSSNNGAYAGLKIKNAGTTLSWNVVAGKVVELKAGVMVANGSLAINGGAATEIDGGSTGSGDNFKKHLFYSATEALYTFTTSNGSAEVIKAITMRDPYEVSFDVNGGDAPIAAMYGTPAVTLPLPIKGSESFIGWFDGETKVGEDGDSYTPTADIELKAHWEAISTDNTLSDLKVGGVTVDGFSPTVHTYYVVLPYGTAVGDIPAISATANSAKAKQVAIEQAVWTGEPYNCYRAQANVQAEDESWGYYDVRFSFGPKDGVSIIKVATTGGTNKTVTGAYAGDGDVNLSSSKKMDKGKYIGFSLDGTTLQAGDKINVHTSTAANTGGSHIIFYDNMTDKNELYDTEEIGGLGDNIFTINAAMVGATTAYVYRSNADAAHQWNGYVDYIEVTRAMDPVLTAITLAGVTADKGTGDAFSATLPNGTNLASMTVVPTIVKNGEGGSAAPTAAWAWGENTYRVTDKDGDYTDYTITLTEAATPSAAPEITSQPQGAEYLEGATIAALEVTATGSGELSYQWYLGENAIDGATAATYTPTVSAIGSYVYHCVVTNSEAGHPATSLASSNATITIAEDPAAIKLLDGEGNINTSDFITGVSKNTVTYGEVEHNCAIFGSTATTAVGASGLNKFIIYNAKTDQTKIKFVLYNTQNGAVTMKLQKLAEGGTEMVEEVINVPSKEEFTTDFYTFNGSANRTMYAFVQNTGIKVLQVKVIDNGAALKQFGEVGYSINFNQGRLFLNSGTDGAYDGLTYNAASNFAPLTNSGLSLTKNKAYRFNVPAAATMTVTAANNAKYYITQTEDGEDNETAVAAATSFDLTAGTWYLRVAGSNLSVTNIAFTAPTCNLAITSQPETNTNFGAGNLTATVVAASTTDGATLSYQWYNANGDVEVSGANTATLTTTTEGEYYVIITASKDGYQDKVVQSEHATLGYRDLTIATLSALSYGTPATAIVLEADKYNYRVTLDEGTTDVPALAATATQAAYGATAVPTDATAFTDYKAVSTVLVTAEDGTTTQTYTVTFVVQHIYAVMEDVTESTTWNWTGVETADVDIDDVDNRGVILGNYISGDNFEMMEGKADEKAFRNQNGGVYQGTYLHFNTTVPGRVKFYFRAPSSGENCTITVINNGKAMTAGTRGNSFGWSKEIVVKGDVVIEMVNDKEGGGETRVQQIVFTELTPDYTRNVSNNIGTLCVDHNVLVGGAMGATFYQIASRNEQYDYKIDFEEVLPGEELKAGEPYIFKSTTGKIELFYGATVADAPVAVRGMHGAYVGFTLGITDDNKSDILYIANNKLWNCEDLVGIGLSVVENRAYIVMSEVPTYDEYHNQQPNNAPIRRCLTISGDQAPAVITGVEGLNVGDQPIKVMIDGQMFILRGEKMYDAQGRLVK